MKEKLGVFFTCFDELEATRFSLNILKRVYPEIRIYLVYEGGIDFSILESEISNLKTVRVDDTMSDVFRIQAHDFQAPHQHAAIKRAALAVIDRLTLAIEYLNSEYVLMMDPDALVRGPLHIPEGAGLLGCRMNSNPSLLANMNAILKKYGGIEVKVWGATPAIFNVKKFMRAREILVCHPTLMDELCGSFYAVFAHDILMAILFSLIGEEEVFNPDIIQIGNHPNWVQTNCPLVHQFRTYYPKRTTKYATANW